MSKKVYKWLINENNLTEAGINVKVFGGTWIDRLISAMLEILSWGGKLTCVAIVLKKLIEIFQGNFKIDFGEALLLIISSIAGFSKEIFEVFSRR